MRCTRDGCIRLRYPCRCSGGALHNNLPFLTVFALR
nr:MAG TPA: Kti11, Kti13 transfer, tRNA modification, Complex [Inoviridae sp.]